MHTIQKSGFRSYVTICRFYSCLSCQNYPRRLFKTICSGRACKKWHCNFQMWKHLYNRTCNSNITSSLIYTHILCQRVRIVRSLCPQLATILWKLKTRLIIDQRTLCYKIIMLRFLLGNLHIFVQGKTGRFLGNKNMHMRLMHTKYCRYYLLDKNEV